ncbi:hypothetical protein Tco_0196540 [Tanacetum coccineum]
MLQHLRCHLHFPSTPIPKPGRSSGGARWRRYLMEVPPRVIAYVQQPHGSLLTVPEPIYPEYIPLEDENEFPVEEQPLPPVDSPTAESPGPSVFQLSQHRNNLETLLNAETLHEKDSKSALSVIKVQFESKDKVGRLNQCKVQEVQSSVTSSEMKQAVGLNPDRRD